MTTIIVTAINALALLGVAAISVHGTRSVRSDVAGVHQEVKTANGQTLAVLADATESRRIAALPAAIRSAAEAAHLARTQPPAN